MLQQGQSLFRSPAGTATLVAGAAAICCAGLYMHLRPVLGELQRPPEEHKITRARTRANAASQKQNKTEKLAYPPDAFPGGRQVKTAYGTIQVFEWGSEEGEKVLLLHGIGTPCVALGDMAKEFVSRGCRVMIFDLFGRGYSDAPADLPYDDRLYTTQILLAIASSPIPWTGLSAFHILGYSLGGALAASFATYHANLLRSLTLVCPGGLVRPSHISRRSRFLYAQGVLPEWLVQRMGRSRLRPRIGAASADVPGVEAEDVDEARDVDFDEVLLSADEPTGGRVRDAVAWQLDGNDGFVNAYISTIRNAPIYAQHDGLWKVLSEQLASRRAGDVSVQGLEAGRMCLILAERDPIVVPSEWIEDAERVLGPDGVDAHVIKGGHEVAISKGKEVARIAIQSWKTKA